jgi:hypothetical protein
VIATPRLGTFPIQVVVSEIPIPSFNYRCVSSFNVIEVSDAYLFAVVLNLGNPFIAPFAPVHTSISGCVVLIQAAPVFTVLLG